MKPCNIATKIVETITCHTASTVNINTIKYICFKERLIKNLQIFHSVNAVCSNLFFFYIISQKIINGYAIMIGSSVVITHAVESTEASFAWLLSAPSLLPEAQLATSVAHAHDVKKCLRNLFIIVDIRFSYLFCV